MPFLTHLKCTLNINLYTPNVTYMDEMMVDMGFILMRDIELHVGTTGHKYYCHVLLTCFASLPMSDGICQLGVVSEGVAASGNRITVTRVGGLFFVGT